MTDLDSSEIINSSEINVGYAHLDSTNSIELSLGDTSNLWVINLRPPVSLVDK